MTMRIKVTNEGPSQYCAVMNREGGELIGTLAHGETKEFYVWDGASVTIRELKETPEETR